MINAGALRPEAIVAVSRTNPVLVGRINGLYGVQGWIRVFDYCREKGDILAYDTWLLGQGGDWNEVRLLNGRVQAKTVVAQLAGYVDREAARRLVGMDIAIREDQLAPVSEGEYYWQDLHGLTVLNKAGETLGIVKELLETGANDALVVDSMPELLIPYTPAVIDKVDLKKRIILVDWERDY